MGNRKIILIGLDRDGVMNHDPGHFGKENNWKKQLKFYGGVAEGIKLLKQNPFIRIIVATNQAGVARGYFDCKRVEEVNNCMDDFLKSVGAFVDAWYYCPYVNETYAKEKKISLPNEWVKINNERKPGIGMLKKACEKEGISLQNTIVFFIGDKEVDIKTGLNAGGKGILIRNGENRIDYLKTKELKKVHPEKIFFANNFLNACQIILDDI